MSSPALPEPADLAGPWTLAGPDGRCELGLAPEDRPVSEGSLAAPMMTVQVATDCRLDIAGWRPIPLGLELTNADGRALLTFEQVGPATYRSIDQVWTLSRS